MKTTARVMNTRATIFTNDQMRSKEQQLSFRGDEGSNVKSVLIENGSD